MRSLIPRVRVPGPARALLARLTPVNVAAWALGGFYLSLMPTLVGIATHLTLPLVGASVVALLMLSGRRRCAVASQHGCAPGADWAAASLSSSAWSSRWLGSR